MTTENAFSSTPQQPEGSGASGGEDANPTLSHLVGDGKKFKSAEDLAIGKIKADEHVTNLEKEMSELRAELDKRLTAEETLKKLQEQSKTPDENTTPMGADELTELIKQELINKSASDTAQANIQTADKALAELYGEKRQEKVSQRAAELGVDVKWMEATAAQSPSAFLKVMGVTDAKPGTPNMTTGTVNPEAVGASHTTPAADTYKHFEDMRKSNPKQYFSAEVQNKMLSLAAENPSKFYNR